MGIPHQTGVSLEPVHGPFFRREGVKIRLDDTVGHGAFQSNRTWCGDDISHNVELGVWHGPGPGF